MAKYYASNLKLEGDRGYLDENSAHWHSASDKNESPPNRDDNPQPSHNYKPWDLHPDLPWVSPFYLQLSRDWDRDIADSWFGGQIGHDGKHYFCPRDDYDSMTAQLCRESWRRHKKGVKPGWESRHASASIINTNTWFTGGKDWTPTDNGDAGDSKSGGLRLVGRVHLKRRHLLLVHLSGANRDYDSGRAERSNNYDDPHNIRDDVVTTEHMHWKTADAEQYLIAGRDVIISSRIRACKEDGHMRNWSHGMQGMAILGPYILARDGKCTSYTRATTLYDNYNIVHDPDYGEDPTNTGEQNDVTGFVRCGYWGPPVDDHGAVGSDKMGTDFDDGLYFGHRGRQESLKLLVDGDIKEWHAGLKDSDDVPVERCKVGDHACPAGSTLLENAYPGPFPVVWRHVNGCDQTSDSCGYTRTGQTKTCTKLTHKSLDTLSAEMSAFDAEAHSAIQELTYKGLAVPGQEYIAILGFLDATANQYAPNWGDIDQTWGGDNGYARGNWDRLYEHGRGGRTENCDETTGEGCKSRAFYHVYRETIVGVDDEGGFYENFHNMEKLWAFAQGSDIPAERKTAIEGYVAGWAASNKYTANEALITDGPFHNESDAFVLSRGDPAYFKNVLNKGGDASGGDAWHRHTHVNDQHLHQILAGKVSLWRDTVVRNMEFVADLLRRDKAFLDLVFAAWSTLNPHQRETSGVSNTGAFLKAFCGRKGGETKRTWTEFYGDTSKYKFEGEGLRQNDPRCFCLGYPFFHEPYMMPVRHDVLCARLRYDSNRTGPLAYHYRQGIRHHSHDNQKVLEVPGDDDKWWRAGEMPGDVLGKLETGTDGLAAQYKRSVGFRTLAHASRGTSYSHNVPDDANEATRLSLIAWLSGDKNHHYYVSGLGPRDVAYGAIDARWLHNVAKDATAPDDGLYLTVKEPSDIGRGQSRRNSKTTYFAFGGGVLSRNTLPYGPDFPSTQYGKNQRVYPEYTEKYNHPREYKDQGKWETWPSLPLIPDGLGKGAYYDTSAGKTSFVFKITKDKTYAEEEKRARETLDSTKWIGGIAVHCPDDVTLRVWTSWSSEPPGKTATGRTGWTEMAHMVKTPEWDAYVGHKDMLPDPKEGHWGENQDSTRKIPLPRLIYEREGTLGVHSIKNVMKEVVSRQADGTDRDLYLSTTGKDDKTKYFKVGRYNESGWSTLSNSTLTAGQVGDVHYPVSPAQLLAFTTLSGRSSSGNTFSSGLSAEDQLMQDANVDKTQQVSSTFTNASGDLQQEPVIAPHTLLFDYKKGDKTKIFPFHQDVDATWVRIDVVDTPPEKLQIMCMAVRTHKPLHVGNYQVVGRDTELLNGFYDLKIGEDKRFDDRSRGWRDGVYVDLAAAGRWDWDADEYYGSGFTALIEQNREATTHSPFCWDTRCKVGRTTGLAKDNDINLDNGQYWVADKCQERLMCLNFIAEQNIINSIDTQVNMINSCAPGGYESLTCKQLRDMEEDMCAGSDWLTNLASISLSMDEALSTAARKTKCCAATAAQGTCDRNVTAEQCGQAGQAYLAELIDNAATVPGTTVQVCCKHNPSVVGAPGAAPPSLTPARCADFDKNQCIPASAYTGELNLSATGSTAVVCCARKQTTGVTCDAFAGCVADDEYTGERVAVPWSIQGATKAVCCEKKTKMCDAFDKDECTYGHHTGDLIEDAATTEGETARECCATEDLFTPIMEDLGLGDAWDEVMQLSFAVRLCILAALVFVGVGAYQRHVQRKRAYGLGGPPRAGGMPY